MPEAIENAQEFDITDIIYLSIFIEQCIVYRKHNWLNRHISEPVTLKRNLI